MRYIDDNFTCYRLKHKLAIDRFWYFNILNDKIQIPTPFVFGGVVAGTSVCCTDSIYMIMLLDIPLQTSSGNCCIELLHADQTIGLHFPLSFRSHE